MTRFVFAGLISAALLLTGTSFASAGDVFVIHHKVADYTKWRPAFDADNTHREAAGLTNPRVYHSLDDPNDLTLVFDMADPAKAKAFAKSKELKSRMMNAGVEGRPTFSYEVLVP